MKNRKEKFENDWLLKVKVKEKGFEREVPELEQKEMEN
jgi:uncharacterized protein YggU (UPF0235/DUF167 family)